MALDNFRMLLVANPQAAGGVLGRKWPALQQAIQKHFGPFAHRFSERPRDATRLTRRALDEGYEMVVALGGDGTISEVADGFFTEEGPVHPEAVLGVLPFGTGGDFRRSIDLPQELIPSTIRLTGRQTRAIDVGRLAYRAMDGARGLRHFINVAGFGISGLVDERVNTHSKALGGRVSFALATLSAMWRYRPQSALLRLDEIPPREIAFHTVAVANGGYFGGGMHIAPSASLDDGLFDVVIVGPQTLRDLLLRGHRLYKGTHLDLPGISLTRARRIEAEPLDPKERILLDVDGEVPGMLPASFEVLAGALRLKT